MKRKTAEKSTKNNNRTVEFLQGLAARIMAVRPGTGTMEPAAEVQEGEMVVGELPDDLKAVYAVLSNSRWAMREQCKTVDRRLEELRRTPPSEIKPGDRGFVAEHKLLHKQTEIIGDIFWHGVREAFPGLATAKSIGLRKGWKVIIAQPQPPVEIMELAESLATLRALSQAVGSPFGEGTRIFGPFRG